MQPPGEPEESAPRSVGDGQDDAGARNEGAGTDAARGGDADAGAGAAESTSAPDPGGGGGDSRDAPDAPGEEDDGPRFVPDGYGSATSGLSPASRTAVALGIGVVALAVAFHLLMVFLEVAPQNTLTKKESKTLCRYINPEFEQNWKLFAPDPLQQNIHVWARAQVSQPGGGTKTTAWVDLTGRDIAKIKHDVAPSHVNQNELRRAWGYFTDSNPQASTNSVPTTMDGVLSQEYIERIVENRFGRHYEGGTLKQIEVRSGTTNVPLPNWTNANNQPSTPSAPSFTTMPWWPVDQQLTVPQQYRSCS
jgi:hypothetical protein